MTFPQYLAGTCSDTFGWSSTGPSARFGCSEARRSASVVELVEARRVLPEELFARGGAQWQVADLAGGALEVDDREVRAEQDLVLPPAIDEVHELRLPVFRPVGVG